MGSFRAESLLDAARQKTGLGDFGHPPFDEPLRRLLNSIET